jgi:Mrp family chromosome partitioning ATPase
MPDSIDRIRDIARALEQDTPSMSKISQREDEARLQPSAAASRSTVPESRGRTIAPTPRPFVSLLYAVEALQEEPRPYILQFTASEAGEGTSTVASGFAQAAAQHAGKSALLVDCNPFCAGTTAGLVELFRTTGSTAGGVRQVPEAPRLSVARLFQPVDFQHPFCDAAVRDVMQHLKQRFDLVVLDCPPANTWLEICLLLSRFCDGAVLVVRAERTARATVVDTQKALHRAGVNLVGTVMNRAGAQVPNMLRNFL